MLFLMNGVKKLKETGRMAIIQNGSSLFTGDADSGQSNIRRYLIENDWLDAIVQLPNDSFYNTGKNMAKPASSPPCAYDIQLRPENEDRMDNER